ncbi:MAG TPA: hypothetical protein VLM18_06880, partial [Croceibacterium sp.]|nr:hypothetical protein [Croceibacterium sp.]
MWYYSELPTPSRGSMEQAAFIERVSDALAHLDCERLDNATTAGAFRDPLLRGDSWGRLSFLASIDELYIIANQSSVFLLLRSTIRFWLQTLVTLGAGFIVSVRWFPNVGEWQTRFVTGS